MAFDVDKFLAQVRRKELLDENVVRELCEKTKQVLLHEGNLRPLQAPVVLVGDIHGQFYDLLEIFEIAGHPPDTNYVFLGDYVDRGYYSVETITLLTLLKFKWPERITLIRGNHESRTVTRTYGFYTECIRKYACVIDDVIYCVHGGLSPSIHTLDQLRVLNRFREIPHEGPIADLVWSDPIQLNSALPGADLTSDFAVSPRGAGYTFGELSTHKFLQVNGLGHICRAHQLCMEGYQILFNDRLSTVWSAPNYCYRAGNLASVLQIAPNLERLFNIFGPCPEDMRDVPGKPLDEKDGSNSLEDYFV